MMIYQWKHSSSLGRSAVYWIVLLVEVKDPGRRSRQFAPGRCMWVIAAIALDLAADRFSFCLQLTRGSVVQASEWRRPGEHLFKQLLNYVKVKLCKSSIKLSCRAWGEVALSLQAVRNVVFVNNSESELLVRCCKSRNGTPECTSVLRSN